MSSLSLYTTVGERERDDSPWAPSSRKLSIDCERSISFIFAGATHIGWLLQEMAHTTSLLIACRFHLRY